MRRSQFYYKKIIPAFILGKIGGFKYLIRYFSFPRHFSRNKW